MSFTQTDALTDAMILGAAAMVDVDSDPGYAIIFDNAAVALVTVVFAQPSGAFVDHEWVFEQGDPSGDIILVQGNADNFALYNGAGTLLGTGDVTDMAGSGTLKVSGTTGTLLYAGARAILGELKLA